LPDQRLGLREAIAGFTSGAAYAAGWEDRLGQLRAGYYADLTVLSEDPFAIEPTDLKHIKPRATMLGGEWVWRE
jgi:predicted amidohydrolase YtcJ